MNDQDANTPLWDAYTIGNMPALPSIPWLWNQYIPWSHVSFMGGMAGAGKSVLAWALALSVATGRPFLDAEVIEGAVLCYDFDSEAGAQGHMLHKVRRGLGLTPQQIGDSLQYRTPTGGLPVFTKERFESVSAEVKAIGPVLIIVDAFTSAHFNVRSNSTEEVAGLMALWRSVARLGPAVLILDHLPKAIANGPSAIERGLIGSTMKAAGSRAAYLLSRLQPRDVQGRDVTALHTLKNNLGPIHEPIGVERVWTDDAVTFNTCDLPEAETSAPGRSRALAALREIIPGDAIGLSSRHELLKLAAERANVQTRTVEKALARLIANDEVVSLPMPNDRRERGYRLAPEKPT